MATLGIGASVPGLLDLTANGRHVAEASGATQPTVAAGNGIAFNGSQLLATASNAALLGPGPWTIFAIVKSDVTAVQRVAMSVSDAGVTQGSAFGVRTSKWSFVDEAVGTFDSVDAFPAATKTLLLFERDGGGPDGVTVANFSLYADGTLAVTASRVYFAASASKIRYGQRGNATAFWKGTLYCAGGISRLLTAGEKTTLLALKSGATFG